MLAASLAWLFSLLHGGALVALADLSALVLFGPGVEASLGGARFVLLLLAGGSLTYAAQAQLGPGAATLAASGAIATLLGCYLALHPRARTLSVSVVPMFATILAVPSAVLIGLWLALQLAIGASGFDEPLRETIGAGAWLFHLLALPLAALAVRCCAAVGTLRHSESR